MSTTFSVDQPIAFLPSIDHSIIVLEQISAEKTRDGWVDLVLDLRTDYTTYTLLEQRNSFNNLPENRLESMDSPFTDTLPVHLTVALKKNCHYLLPDTQTDLAAHFQELATDAPLLQEKRWEVLSVLQQEELPEAEGGAVLVQSGYRTRSTQPSDEAEALKKSGPVSRAVVEALQEQNFPVYYSDTKQAFEIDVALGDHNYKVLLAPHDIHFTLSLTVFHQQVLETAHLTAASTSLRSINAELSLGDFSINNNHFTFFQFMKVPREFLHRDWVNETMAVALELCQKYYSRITAA